MVLRIIKEIFAEPIQVIVSDLEIYSFRNQNNAEIYLIRKVHNAIHTEVTRPWREVLGSDTE